MARDLPGAPAAELAGLGFAWRVAYSPRRRRVSVRIQDGQALVCAPSGASEERVLRALLEHQDWVRRHLEEDRRLGEAHGLVEPAWRDGGCFMWRGAPLAIELGAGRAEFVRGAGRTSRLRLASPLAADASAVRAAARAWCIGEAGRVIAERFAVMQERSPVPHAGMKVIGLKTVWGRCWRDGRLEFSWRLALFEDDVIDYVVATSSITSSPTSSRTCSASTTARPSSRPCGRCFPKPRASSGSCGSRPPATSRPERARIANSQVRNPLGKDSGFARRYHYM
ncbi:MAG: DUF45 domain-containing protein [Duodenibacillus sp.]|nr:DUF45 domain-containing protein [Duodenibacillus sp.]